MLHKLEKILYLLINLSSIAGTCTCTCRVTEMQPDEYGVESEVTGEYEYKNEYE